MSLDELRPYQHRLMILALIGFFILNGVFVYAALLQPELLATALRNPIGAVFILEAFILVGLFAWMIHAFGVKGPGWMSFVLLSLLGGLAFSIPLFLLVHMRRGGSAGRGEHSGAR